MPFRRPLLDGHPWLLTALLFSHVLPTTAQLTPKEWSPLLDGLSSSPDHNLAERVPLMTNDTVKIPLIDLQVFAPPSNGEIQHDGGCTVKLLEHSFGVDSFGNPTVIDYVPPAGPRCGKTGDWAEISLNLTVYCIGTQYDRLGSIYLSHVEIWRTSSAEPTQTGTIWTTVKDVTHFSPLFAQQGDLMMDFQNIIAPELLLDGVFNVTLAATFTPSNDLQRSLSADLIIPLSNLSPTSPNLFTIEDDLGATTNITLPDDTAEVYIEVFASGNSAEEFWYTNTPDEFLPLFPESTGLIGKGPFRELQVLIDGRLGGVVWPYGVIYTGGITPTNWRPLTSYGAYDSPTYWVDITPFLPQLLSTPSHSVTLAIKGQGKNPSFNSNWFVSGSIHVRRGASKTSGVMRKYHAPDPTISTTGGILADNQTVWTRVEARRLFMVESELQTSAGTRVVTFTQDLQFINTARYGDDGWLQWVNQTSNGTTSSIHAGEGRLRDAFIYPLNIFSNYSNFLAESGGYGSEVNQTYTRALQPPTDIYRSVHSVQHAKGDVEMDNWPGLRHAIRGNGQTDQRFAYADGHGQTYFRDIASKNDGWIRDTVWGSLREGNLPVSHSQLYGPEGGPGFR